MQNFTVKHYRKRPVTIEAARFPSTPAESQEVTDWLNEHGYPWLIGDALHPETLRYTRDDNEIPERGIYIDPADGALMIRTLEGDMKVTPGDFIIRGVAGEVYPCKPGIFAKTYEEVAPAWPDPPVIVIDEGEWHGPNTGAIVFKEGIVAIRDDDCGSYTDAEGSLWWEGDGSTIKAWHEYVPDGYVPQEKVYEAAAQGAAAAAPEPRREYTADDLDNLPEGTCAWDENGCVWQRDASDWFMAGGCGISHNPLREGIRRHLYSAPPEEN